MTDTRLQELVDRAAIIDTITRLFISTDQRNWDAVKACFAPQVQFDMTSMGGGEPAQMTPGQIAGAWEQGLQPLKAVHHLAGNHVVCVEGDRAAAFCYGIASHYLPNASGRNTRTFTGSYDFRLVREAGQWRISGFRFNLKYVDGNVYLERS
jgi:hypothetical protein